MQKSFMRVFFIVFIVSCGLFIGKENMPDQWYISLNKAPFNPPNWVFGPIWTVLYILIAIAGIRTYEKSGLSLSFGLWILQMVLNFTWSPIFFGMHNPKMALSIILITFLVILLYIVYQWTRDRISSILFIPYIAWISLASVLNMYIVLLN
ncbi:Tryptophan-rich sensory protein [Liberibacter crescens BT-1]|uniref:Tryptophan-rich sensory protein n=1 Tax=Liberibacter crescens (strain BT-1) TaxID=1215343 RepID=L0EW56_LIBCB|nr:TspO/MBR family protein [Liberibacter crescens]AGA65192.1 Tryptophan-rich sensory protein [Liberibacter crescens BT-1]AMC13148.1 CrtK/TspO family sensor protein [Liberibacter crescens]